MTSLDEVARNFVDLLDRLGAPYALVGGLAVRVHALPRPTFDVDFTVSLSRESLPDLYHQAEHRGLTIPPPQTSGWIVSVAGLPVVKSQWFIDSRAIDIDVFLAETEFQGELLARRQRHGMNGWNAWFATAKDLILLKLLADRPKDRTDISDFLFIQGELDVFYLRHWAVSLGIAERLETALAADRL